MARTGWRHGVRALVVDEDDRVLLCRMDLRATGGPVVWAAPGGGVEEGEPALVALRRELDEEIGLHVDGEPPLVWRQEAAGPQYASGYQGAVNEYFWIRTSAFEPRGAWSDERLAAEYITTVRWWSLPQLDAHAGGELFSPRDFPVRFRALLAGGVPQLPTVLIGP